MTLEVNTGNAAQLLNQKQTAEVLGLTSGRLSQLKKEGRITYSDPERRLYDPHQVAAQMRLSSDVRQVVATETRRQARDAGAAEVQVAVQPTTDVGAELDEDEPIYGSDYHENYKIAASFEKRDAARIARIERLKLEGAVGLVAEMEREAYTEARIVRDTLLGALPAKLAPALAPITDVFELEQKLREGLREALHDIVRQVEAGPHAVG